MGKSERKWIFILILFAGLVLGGLLGEFSKGNPSLKWINYGQEFGLPQDLNVNLIILVLRFGFTVKISVANIIGILIGLFIAKLLKY